MSRRGLCCKVVFLGDTSVGKSCLTVRFVRNEYFEFQEPTIGAAFLAKNIDYQGKNLKLEIWDTAGQERYRSLAPMYYRGARAAVVVYDITQKDTLIGAKSWITELQSKQAGCVIVLVGNKCDLNETRTINTEDVEEYARENHLIHIESSAKTGCNVKEIFNIICREILAQPDEDEEDNIVVHPEIGTVYSKSNNCC
jgi:Ras-related protein Rab-5C